MANQRSDAPDAIMPLLLRLYVPIMFLCLIVPALFGSIAVIITGSQAALFLPVFLVIVCGIHLLLLFMISLQKLGKEKDWFEMKLDAEQKVKLREFVIEIARKWDTPRPDDIRLSAASAAHVYETKKGKRILVIGGVALAALSREALGSIIAHELTHFEYGDTAMHWRNLTGFTMMQRLGAEFRMRWAHLVNPAVWPLVAFQFFVELRCARHSRDCEYRCDAKAASHAGPTATAAALIYLCVVDEMPWANIMDVLSMAATVGASSPDVFSEQARRASLAQFEDWEEASREVMRQRTKPWDTHPALGERLDAIGATLEEGLDYLLDDDGPSARSLIKDWRHIERKLSANITSAYQVWREQRNPWAGYEQRGDD